MVSKKQIARNRLLIRIVSFLALFSQASFSEVELDSKSDTHAITEKSLSDENHSDPIKLYTIKIHYKNKSSENLVYASFDEVKQKYVVVCQSVDEQYQDAQKKCDLLRKDAYLGIPINIAGLSRNTIDFRASEYRDQNKIWKLLSYLYKRYPVNLDVLLPEPSSGELTGPGWEKQAVKNIQSHESEHQIKVVEKDLEAGFSKPQTLPLKNEMDTFGYDYESGADVIDSQDVRSDEVNSGYSNFDIGSISLGIAGLFAAGTEIAAYKNKWWWHGIDNQKETDLNDEDIQKLDSNYLTDEVLLDSVISDVKLYLFNHIVKDYNLEKEGDESYFQRVLDYYAQGNCVTSSAIMTSVLGSKNIPTEDIYFFYSYINYGNENCTCSIDHSFVILELNKKTYLLDATAAQFHRIKLSEFEKNSDENLIIRRGYISENGKGAKAREQLLKRYMNCLSNLKGYPVESEEESIYSESYMNKPGYRNSKARKNFKEMIEVLYQFSDKDMNLLNSDLKLDRKNYSMGNQWKNIYDRAPFNN